MGNQPPARSAPETVRTGGSLCFLGKTSFVFDPIVFGFYRFLRVTGAGMFRARFAPETVERREYNAAYRRFLCRPGISCYVQLFGTVLIVLVLIFRGFSSVLVAQGNADSTKTEVAEMRDNRPDVLPEDLRVRLYGVGHVSADLVDDGSETEEFFASNSSRLGLRGAHALTDTVDAVFQFESGMDLTGQGGNDGNGGKEGDGNLFTAPRDSFLGLVGRFGSFRAGKLPGLNQWVYDYNLFADKVGDLGNVWGGTGLPGRVTNAVQYRSPEFHNLNAGVTYVPDEDGEATEDLSIAKVDYVQEDLSVGNTLELGAAFAHLQQSPGEHWNTYALTARYEFDGFTVGGGWHRETNIGGLDGNDRDSLTVGGSVQPWSDGTLKTQYVYSAGDQSRLDAQMVAAVYEHEVTEHWMVYVAYARTWNDAGATFAANNYGKGDAVTPAPGKDPSAISIGLVFDFNIGWGDQSAFPF